MTQDIKAAIAGAIEALEYAISHIHMGQSTFFPDRLAALLRIEFVEVEGLKRGDTWHPPDRIAWNNCLNEIETTGHAIVKMGKEDV